MTVGARLVRLDGPAMGAQLEVTRSLAVLGSHSSADHPIAGTDAAPVSPRHAALIRSGAIWLLRDLQSATGTWLNGSRIVDDTPLNEGDEIRLGAEGPALRFQRVPAPAAKRSGTPWSAIVAVAVLLVAVGWWSLGRPGTEPEPVSRSALLARVDSLAAQLDSAQRRADRLGSQLDAAVTEMAAMRGVLLDAPPRAPTTRLDSLAAAVRELAERQAPLLRAANLDLASMAAGNQDAISLVLAERVGGEVVSGTGFAARRSGDTTWVVTSRHVVVDSEGGAANRLGLVFNGTAQNFPATIERTHPSADLALLRVVIRGGTPVVRGVGAGPTPGEPVGTITFPGELDLSPGAAWRKVGVAASSFSAIVTAVEGGRLQLDGYGAVGMSGSPVFRSDGMVVGVIFGGAIGAGGRIVFAEPGARIGELLDPP